MCSIRSESYGVQQSRHALERGRSALSDGVRVGARTDARPGSPSWNAGGDGPAWSRKRQPYEPRPTLDPHRPLTATRCGPRCRMPSCTATPTSRSSTVHRIPNSWPRRPTGSASRRWRSPITTVSTAWCASPRRREPWVCPRCSAPRSRCRATANNAGVARSEADTLQQQRVGHRRRASCPRSARPAPARAGRWTHRVRAAGACAQPRPSGGGEGLAAVHAARPRRRRCRALVGADRLPQGCGARGARRPMVRGQRRASCSD